MRKFLNIVALGLAFFAGSAHAETPWPDPTSAPTFVQNYKGVNIDGLEFNGGSTRYGYDYIAPSTAEMDYVASKGLGTIRVPFDWGRVYSTAFGDLDPTEVGRLKTVIDYAYSKHLRVILDPHTYGYVSTRDGKNTTLLVGRDATGTALFVDSWAKLATKTLHYPNVIFGLMNEPHDQTAAEWFSAADQAVKAIRATGAKQLILLQGTSWDGTPSFAPGSDNAKVWSNYKGDPENNFAFDLHQYLDSDNSGTHAACASGAWQRVQGATTWLNSQGYHAIMGEAGWSSDPSCPPEAKALFDFMSANSSVWLGWTYWNMGPWSGSYMYDIDPVNGADKPQMGVLTGHL